MERKIISITPADDDQTRVDKQARALNEAKAGADVYLIDERAGRSFHYWLEGDGKVHAKEEKPDAKGIAQSN